MKKRSKQRFESGNLRRTELFGFSFKRVSSELQQLRSGKDALVGSWGGDGGRYDSIQIVRGPIIWVMRHLQRVDAMF